MPITFISDQTNFPDPKNCEPDGLLAVGGDLSIERLILAYSNGIFPWYEEGFPILWWSPDPRMVLFPSKFKVSDSLRRLVKKQKFEIKFDNDFYSVIKMCAKVPRHDQDDTWITGDMINAYCTFHEKGYAHSVEAYFEGQLVGGLYGVSIGKAFFGESMFHVMSDASKVAFNHLVKRIMEWDFHFIDTQVETKHLSNFGAELISREDFLKILDKAIIEEGKYDKWHK